MEGSSMDHPSQKLSREFIQLINSAKESKIISECVSIDKVRKSRRDTYEASLNSPQSTTSLDKSERSRASSNASNSSDVSSKATEAKRVMRSQNVEFAMKHKQFLKACTGRVSPTLSGDEGGKADLKEVLAPMSITDPTGRRMDPFCWHCHRVVGSGGSLLCSVCPRSYHNRCVSSKVIRGNKWACPECVNIMNADNVDNRSPAMRRITVDKLRVLLKFALAQMESIPGCEPFISDVDLTKFPSYSEYVIHPMNLRRLAERVDGGEYGSTGAFLADTRWIVHNSVIFNSSQTKLTTVAKAIMKRCRTEMNSIEICPECYLNANTRQDWFIQACSKPHVLVWAKLKGFPYWPAKAMAISSSGLVDVRFFGAHDKTWLRPKDCYLYCHKDPNTNNKSRKNEIAVAVEELNKHIEKLQARFGPFKAAAFKTPYSPHSDDAFLKMMLPNYVNKDGAPSGPVVVPCSPEEKAKGPPLSHSKNIASMQPKVMLTSVKNLNNNFNGEKSNQSESSKIISSTRVIDDLPHYSPDVYEDDYEIGEVISTYERSRKSESSRSRSQSQTRESPETVRPPKRVARSRSICATPMEEIDTEDELDAPVESADESKQETELTAGKRKRTLSESGNPSKKWKKENDFEGKLNAFKIQTNKGKGILNNTVLRMKYKEAVALKYPVGKSTVEKTTVSDKKEIPASVETKKLNNDSLIEDSTDRVDFTTAVKSTPVPNVENKKPINDEPNITTSGEVKEMDKNVANGLENVRLESVVSMTPNEKSRKPLLTRRKSISCAKIIDEKETVTENKKKKSDNGKSESDSSAELIGSSFAEAIENIRRQRSYDLSTSSKMDVEEGQGESPETSTDVGDKNLNERNDCFDYEEIDFVESDLEDAVTASNKGNKSVDIENDDVTEDMDIEKVISSSTLVGVKKIVTKVINKDASDKIEDKILDDKNDEENNSILKLQDSNNTTKVDSTNGDKIKGNDKINAEENSSKINTSNGGNSLNENKSDASEGTKSTNRKKSIVSTNTDDKITDSIQEKATNKVQSGKTPEKIITNKIIIDKTLNKPKNKTPEKPSENIKVKSVNSQDVGKTSSAEVSNTESNSQAKERFVNSLSLRPNDNNNANNLSTLKAKTIAKAKNTTTSIINGQTSVLCNTTIKRITGKSPKKTNESDKAKDADNSSKDAGENRSSAIVTVQQQNQNNAPVNSPKVDNGKKPNLSTSQETPVGITKLPNITVKDVNAINTASEFAKNKNISNVMAKKLKVAEKPAVNALTKIQPVPGKNLFKIISTEALSSASGTTIISKCGNAAAATKTVNNSSANETNPINTPRISSEMTGNNTMVYIPSENVIPSQTITNDTTTSTVSTAITNRQPEIINMVIPMQTLISDGSQITDVPASSSVSTVPTAGTIRVISSSLLQQTSTANSVPPPTSLPTITSTLQPTITSTSQLTITTSSPPTTTSLLGDEWSSIPPANAGPVSAIIRESAYKMTEYFSHLLEQSICKVGEQIVPPDPRILQLKLNNERLRYQYLTKIKELEHSTKLQIKEIRENCEAEKQRCIMEVRHQCEIEKMAAVNDAKQKMWCVSCGREATLHCCRFTTYCQAECQLAHWPTHMPSCMATDKTNDTNHSTSNNVTIQSNAVMTGNGRKILIGKPFPSPRVIKGTTALIPIQSPPIIQGVSPRYKILTATAPRPISTISTTTIQGSESATSNGLSSGNSYPRI